jgi:SEC-C motif-containing protein
MANPAIEPCPCGSGRTYAACCEPWHRGTPAPTAEALMRSRYTAYRFGLADYIVATTHPDSPHFEADRAAWLAGIRRFSTGTAFQGLTIRAASTAGANAMVEFQARLRQGGRDATMVERSTFARVGGRWLYLAGVNPDRAATP